MTSTIALPMPTTSIAAELISTKLQAGRRKAAEYREIARPHNPPQPLRSAVLQLSPTPMRLTDWKSSHLSGKEVAVNGRETAGKQRRNSGITTKAALSSQIVGTFVRTKKNSPQRELTDSVRPPM